MHAGLDLTASPVTGLGSPAHFPPTPAASGGGHYLPQYLLGGSTGHASPVRPGGSNLWTGQLGMSTPPSDAMPNQRPVATQSSIKAKAAPPVEGLFEVSSPTSMSKMDAPTNSSFTPISRGLVTPNAGTLGTPGPMESVSRVQGTFSRHHGLSPAQVDPFYSQGDAISSETVLDERWVTVFGFPAESSPYILQQFSQCGTIVRHEAACNCNWMHICYESPLQAKKALSKNGKVFAGSMMVAVQPCIEQSVMHGDQPKSVSMATFAPSSAALTRTPGSSMRPLTAAYRTSSDKYEVEPAATAQKSSSILSKAVEYMFSW